MFDAITSTVAAAGGPLGDPVAFRAAVLAWLGVVSVVLLATRPLLLDLVDLVWALRREWDSRNDPPGGGGKP